MGKGRPAFRRPKAASGNRGALIRDPVYSSWTRPPRPSTQNSRSLIQEAGPEHLMRGRTTFVVAHRLSTIRNADRIIVMEAGRIAESGDHAQLLENNGVYARLYSH